MFPTTAFKDMPRGYRWTLLLTILILLGVLPIVLLRELAEWKRRTLLVGLAEHFRPEVEHVERTAVTYRGILDDDPTTDCPAWESLSREEQVGARHAVNDSRDEVNYYHHLVAQNHRWQSGDLLELVLRDAAWATGICDRRPPHAFAQVYCLQSSAWCHLIHPVALPPGEPYQSR